MKRLIIMITILSIFTLVYSEQDKRIAVIKELQGRVEVKTAKGGWLPAKEEMVLTQGDIIRTLGNSWAILDLDGAAETATIEIKENSQVKLTELLKKGDIQNTVLDIALGEIFVKAQKIRSPKSKFEIRTPTSLVGVRGTTFAVTVEAVE